MSSSLQTIFQKTKQNKQKYQNKTIMKKFLSLIVMCLIAGTTSVFADENNYLYLDKTISAEAGKQVVVPVYMNNTEKIGGLQFDIYTSKELSLAYEEEFGEKIYSVVLGKDRASDRTHSTTITPRTDKEEYFVRVISAPNGAGKIYYGNSGVVYNITFDVAENAPEGEYYVKLKEITLANTDGIHGYKQDEISCIIQVKSTTVGIAEVKNSENVEYYNMEGQKMNSSFRGLNIIKKADGSVIKVAK